MHGSLLISMALFSLGMSISPGPVNVKSMSSGVNRGFRGSLGFISGATLGFTAELLFVGFGLAALIDADGLPFKILKVCGGLYILYVGVMTFRSQPGNAKGEASSVRGSGSGFWQGAAMQWLNPKAWIACISGVSLFEAIDRTDRLLVFSALYFVICYLSIALWAFAGARLTQAIGNPKTMGIMHKLLSLLLIFLALYMMIL